MKTPLFPKKGTDKTGTVYFYQLTGVIYRGVGIQTSSKRLADLVSIYYSLARKTDLDVPSTCNRRSWYTVDPGYRESVFRDFLVIRSHFRWES